MRIESLSSSNWVLHVDGVPFVVVPGYSGSLPDGVSVTVNGSNYVDQVTNAWCIVLGDGPVLAQVEVTPTGEYWMGFLLGLAVVGVACTIVVIRRALSAGDYLE